MKRKHYSSEQQQQLVAEWRSSGMSAERFANHRGFSVGTLWRWRKLWDSVSAEPMFRPLILSQAKIVQEPAQEAELSSAREGPVVELLVSGLTARIYAGMSPGELTALVAALRGVVPC